MPRDEDETDEQELGLERVGSSEVLGGAPHLHGAIP